MTSSSALAEGTCSVQALTRKCQYFTERSNQPYLTFAGGTRFRNYAYRKSFQDLLSENSNPPTSPQEDEKVRNELEAKTLQLQADTIRHADLRGGELFKIAITNVNVLNEIGKFLLSQESSISSGAVGSLRIPWPSDGDEVQAVKISAFLKDYVNKLPEKGKTTYLENAKKTARAFREYDQKQMPEPEPAPKPTPKLSIPEERKRQVFELAKKAKDLLLEELFEKRPYKSLKPYERATYDKVASIQIEKSIERAGNDPLCQTSNSNAFYSPTNHTFSVCPEVALAPDSTLIGIFAHEMAHAIGPCHFQSGTYRFNRKKYEAAQTADKIALDEINPNHEATFLGDNSLADLEKKGILDVISAWIPADAYLFQSAKQCLMKKEVFRQATKDDDAAERARYHLATQPIDASPAEVKQAFRKEMTRNPECFAGQLRPSQAEEVMADAWGSKVLGRYLEKNPPASEDEKLAPLIFFLSTTCESIEKYVSLEEAYSSSHPYPRFRTEEIFLQDERIQRALDCKPKSQDACLRQIGTTGSVENQDPKLKSSEGKR